MAGPTLADVRSGIAVDLKIDCSALDDKIDTVLATVLREGVTNISGTAPQGTAASPRPGPATSRWI